TVTFWKRFRAVNSEQRLKRITAAVQRILDDPQGTGLAYALKETKCCRCGRDLTVPASIHAGLGPGCARKGHWNKVDQKTVYQNQMQNRP
ncbi:MAG: hypothetical protein KGI50_07750, partial [Patescibacteria group bacterium]|nr:hypothetical protein [Patescibacteria group bacterium]